MKPDRAPTEYFEPLQCGLLRVEVDFESRIVTLSLPEGHCTDMRGAIAYASTLDKNVRAILSMPEHERGVSYHKYDGEWKVLEL